MRGLWLLFTFVILLFAAMTVGCIMIFEKYGWRPLLVSFGVVILFWFIAELITGIIFYSYAQFVPEQKKQGTCYRIGCERKRLYRFASNSRTSTASMPAERMAVMPRSVSS